MQYQRFVNDRRKAETLFPFRQIHDQMAAQAGRAVDISLTLKNRAMDSGYGQRPFRFPLSDGSAEKGGNAAVYGIIDQGGERWGMIISVAKP